VYKLFFNLILVAHIILQITYEFFWELKKKMERLSVPHLSRSNLSVIPELSLLLS